MEDILISNTTDNDFTEVLSLFRTVIDGQKMSGLKVWDRIDESGLRADLDNRLQYKITRDGQILCVFSIQYSDPMIWSDREKGDAIYLHRIVSNPAFKGEAQFARVLDWALKFAGIHSLQYIRMDTWAENQRLIRYYETYGFGVIERVKTSGDAGLPLQNRNLDVVLLQLEVSR